MKITYSKHADVLYIILSATTNPCRYVELPNSVITRIDEVSQQVVGVTVYNFMQKMEQGEGLTISDIGENLSGVLLLNLYTQAQ